MDMKRYKTFLKQLKPREIIFVSFLDLFFVLLVFFIMITSYDFQLGFVVNLPKTNQATFIAGSKINLFLGKRKKDKWNDEIVAYLNNDIVLWVDLETKLLSFIKEENKIFPFSKPILSLKVDEDISYKYLIQIYSIAKKLNLQINNVVER